MRVNVLYNFHLSDGSLSAKNCPVRGRSLPTPAHPVIAGLHASRGNLISSIQNAIAEEQNSPHGDGWILPGDGFHAAGLPLLTGCIRPPGMLWCYRIERMFHPSKFNPRHPKKHRRTHAAQTKNQT